MSFGFAPVTLLSGCSSISIQRLYNKSIVVAIEIELIKRKRNPGAMSQLCLAVQGLCNKYRHLW